MSNFTNLIVSGCSFMAYPWEWDSYERPSYSKKKDPGRDKQYLAKTYNFSALISKKLGIPELNLAYPSNSNTNAIRRATDSILGHNLNNSLVFLGLTQLIRHDIPIQGSDKFTSLKITASKNAAQLSTLTEVTQEEIDNYLELWYKLNYDKNILFNEVLMSLDLLNGIITSRGGELVVWNNLLELDITVNRDYFFKLNNKVFNWPKFIQGRDKKYKFGQHPNSDDHLELSRMLIDRYINKNSI